MDQRLYDIFADCPVVPAVKDEKELAEVMLSELPVVFVLYGDICSIGGIVEQLKKAGKLVVVHADLIQGLSPKEVAVDFLNNNTKADGIISTKTAMCARARQLGMLSIYRIFVLDSKAIESAKKQVHGLEADMVEILPGVMPKIIKKMCGIFKCPVIAGGLIQDKEDVMQALDAGAISISTTNQDVWRM